MTVMPTDPTQNEAALPAITDPIFSGYSRIRALRQGMPARQMWTMLHETISPAHVTELALEYGSVWGAHPSYCRSLARIYSTMFPVALRATVLGGPFPTAAMYGSGVLMLPDPRIVRVDFERSLKRAVPPNELRELWDPKPREVARHLRRSKQLLKAVHRLSPEERDQEKRRYHERLMANYAEAVYAATPGVWDPFIGLNVLVHEFLHVHLGHTTNVTQSVLQYLDEADRKAAQSVLNIAFDSHLHTLVHMHEWITVFLQMIDFPPQLGGGGGPVMRDPNAAENDDTAWSSPDEIQDETEDVERDLEQRGISPDQIERIQDGESGIQYSALFHRRRVIRTIREEAQQNKQIGNEAALAELLLDWERQARRDVFTESITRFRASVLEAVSAALFAESQYPDPTDRYLIRKNKVRRRFPLRDDESVAVRLLVIIDSSGSMSDHELVDAIEAISVALGGQGLCDAFFCDTHPLPIGFDLFTSDLPYQVRQMREIPRGGTSLGEAIRQYETTFQRSLRDVSAVIMLTDGYNNDWAIDRLRESQTPLVVGHIGLANDRGQSLDLKSMGLDYEHVRYVPIERSVSPTEN